MRILYGYSNCTDKTYNRIVSERNVPTMVPDQKYHSLMIKGFSKNGAEVCAFFRITDQPRCHGEKAGLGAG